MCVKCGVNWGTSIRINLGFTVLLKATLTCGQEGLNHQPCDYWTTCCTSTATVIKQAVEVLSHQKITCNAKARWCEKSWLKNCRFRRVLLKCCYSDWKKHGHSFECISGIWFQWCNSNFLLWNQMGLFFCHLGLVETSCEHTTPFKLIRTY